MRHGFIKVATATPTVKVADCQFNSQNILELINKAHNEGVHLLVLPQLCVTGATCQDLFFQQTLIDRAKQCVIEISKKVPRNMVVVFGAPLKIDSRLFNCAVVATGGKILGIVPKTDTDDRWFSGSFEDCCTVDFEDGFVNVSDNILFVCNQLSDFCFGVEIGDELFSLNGKSAFYVENGANIIVNLGAFESYSGRTQSISSAIVSKSAFLKSAYIFADIGEGESTTDFVYTAQNIICENGNSIALQNMKENELLISELDLQYLNFIHRIKHKPMVQRNGSRIEKVLFDIEMGETQLTRTVSKNPFLPSENKALKNECEKIITLQALGLKKRLEHIHCQTVVIGISGGLDSTLALLVAVKTFDMLAIDRSNIICVTMPCFGTSSETKSNAVTLVNSLGCTLLEIDISDAVRQHFKDIEQDETVYDATFENSQARERTQVLMDIANKENGIVIGTGDLSELALGWATYNGDHMSMYSVNASVPKTVIRAVVLHQAMVSDNQTLKDVLFSVLDTPVSPELVPGTQNTEDIVGPYELHDFFLYCMLDCGCMPSKILRLAKYAFADAYSEETITKWLKVFLRRFFTQQFKRSCMPDGPKVTSVSLSPRMSWLMPSDACFREWNRELEESLLN